MGIRTNSAGLPETQRAVKVTGTGGVATIDGCSLPNVSEEDVLVRVVYVALNPVDGKSIDMSPTMGATVGCDFAGEIVQLGRSARDGFLTVGSRVFGCVFGNNPLHPENGAFAEYVAVPAKLVLRIPSDMDYREASTFGIGLATVGLALYHELGLKCTPSSPAETGFPVFVSGGGTATGALAVQILKLSGLQPIVTCSPHNADRLKRLGAAAIFDYRSPACGSDIREYTADKLAFALDCQADMGSTSICYDAIGVAGGKYMSLNPFPLRAHRRRSVKPNWVFLFTQFDQAIPWKRPYQRDARPKDKDFATAWYQEIQGLIDAGRIVSSPYREKTGGLSAVIDGIEAVARGETGGSKLVYRVAQD